MSLCRTPAKPYSGYSGYQPWPLRALCKAAAGSPNLVVRDPPYLLGGLKDPKTSGTIPRHRTLKSAKFLRLADLCRPHIPNLARSKPQLVFANLLKWVWGWLDGQMVRWSEVGWLRHDTVP